MKKFLSFLSLLSILHITTTQAQQQYYDWQLGAGVGAMAYYGDLTYKLNAIKINAPAYQFTLGRNISPSFALLLHTQFGKISANDRAQNWNGNLQTANPNFTRALNFQTDVRNANLLLSYRLNNGKILSRYAAVGPYIFAGVGVTDFTVFGDLFNGPGQRYHYWSDNTIRNLPENPANAGQAQVIRQDRDFETQLNGLQTETDYPTTVLNIPVGAGIKFRLSERWSANIQSIVNYAFTGYLDDINGPYTNDYTNEIQAYAANPSGIRREMRGNNKNDMFISTIVSLNYHFNAKRKKFEAPMVYTGYQQPVATVAKQSTSDTDANEPEKNRIDSIPSIPTPPVTSTPAVAKAIPQTRTSPEEAANLSPENNRQTVDVNVRIFVERGDSVAYEARTVQPGSNMREQGIQTRTYLNSRDSVSDNLDTVRTDVSLRSVYNQAQINALRNELDGLKQELQTYRAQGDTISQNQSLDTVNRPPSTRPQQNARPDTVRLQPEQNQQRVIRQQNLQQSNREVLLNRKIDSLTNELRTLETQPQAQSQQNARTTDVYRNNQDIARQQAIGDNQDKVQAQQQYDYSREVNSLRRELADLRNEMNRQNYLRANALQNYPAPGNNRTAVVTVPNALAANRYDAQEMNQLKKELSAVKQELSNLQAQQQTSDTTQLGSQVDSLLNLVAAIDRAQQLNAQPNNSDANTANVNADQANNEQLMNALRSQITGLNESLDSMQNQLTAIETAPPAAPLSALGSTIVYYDINKSDLKPDDQQRLSVLANRLKADKSVLLNIKGYTDQTGNAAYNLMLSKKRAETIRQYFVADMGISPDQILVNYFGQQATSGDASKNNPYDRRVELQLFRENAGN